MIKNNDRATCEWYGGRRGLTMYDPNSKIYLTLLVRGGYQVTDADKFWYGRWSSSNYHYFDNKTDSAALTNTDSAFSVSWENRDIYPNDTIAFSVLMGVGKNLKNPPILTITNEFQTNYNPDQEVTITGKVDDFDANETVDVYYEFNNQPARRVDTFPTDEKDGKIADGSFSFTVKLGNAVASYPLKVYALDSFGLKSNEFSRGLLVNEAPKVDFTTRPNQEYFTGGIVVVEGSIWDDTKATLKYKIDNGYNWNTDEMFECNRQTKAFRKTFPIQEDYINFGDHIIYIWAEDEFGVKSTIISSPFKYTQLHTPEIKFEHEENTVHEFHRGDTITITGYARDVDKNQVFTIKYKNPEDSPTQPANDYASFPTNSYPDWTYFALEYTIPNNMAFNQEQKLILFVVDNKNANSADLIYKFKVIKRATTPPTAIEPTPLPPDEYSDVVDSSYSGHTAESDVPTITCTILTDVNDDQYESCTITDTTIYIKTSIYVPPRTVPERTPIETPPISPLPSPSQSPEVFPGDEEGNGDNAKGSSASKKKDNKKKTIIIGAAAGGVAAVAIGAAAFIIHEAIKPPKDFVFNDENGEFMEVDGNGGMENADNPIYDENGADDPFADEFDEDEAPVEGIFPA